MKGAFFFFIIGFGLGCYAMYKYDQSQPPPSTAAQAQEKFDQKLSDWHLTKPDIENDLSKTGEVVRTKAAQAGSRIEDARIHAVIKSKYVLDRDLYGQSITITVTSGAVALTGSVTDEAFISKAVALAMDTDGVTVVKARLAVQPKAS
jgi:hypothetical protein